MLLALLDAMDAPLEERNSALLAAGYAPQYPARSLADQDMFPVREALSHLLSTHEPAPAMGHDGGRPSRRRAGACRTARQELHNCA